MTLNELQKMLDHFKAEVIAKDLFKEKRINFFSITKMLNLETKHSAFLAWLLSPENEHKLGITVLEKLLCKLYDYDNIEEKVPAGYKKNSDILNLANINGLLKGSVKVSTEVGTNNRKRMDLYINIPETSTIIVIENKIDSGLHDNQLVEYQDYINNTYSNYNHKIFIFLTKLGNVPYNINGDYNSSWCILSYSSIRAVIEEVVSELKKGKYSLGINSAYPNERQDLIKILEDYIDMIDTNILTTEKVAREKCRELLEDQEVRRAFEMLKAYERIPTVEQINEYVREKLGGLRISKSKFHFTMPKIKEYFENKDGSYILAQCRIVCEASNSKDCDSSIVIYIDISDANNANKQLTDTQIDLIKKCGQSEYNKKGELRHDARAHKEYTLVDSSARGKTMDELKSELDLKIAEYNTNYLQPFLAKL